MIMNMVNIKNNKYIGSCKNIKNNKYFKSKFNNSNTSVSYKNSSKLKQYKSVEHIICKNRTKKVRFAEPIVTEVIKCLRLDKRHNIDLFYSKR